MDEGIVSLYSDRLILRKITPETLDRLFSRGNDAEIMSTLCLDSQEELEDERRKFHEGISTYNRSFVWFKLLERGSGVHIGAIGYHIWYTDHDRAEIGYALKDDQFKNKGYMTEAMAVVLEYGFKEMNLHRVEAFVGSNNTPSLLIMKRFGFVQEGHLREHYLRRGVYEDSLVFSLLVDAYKSAD